MSLLPVFNRSTGTALLASTALTGLLASAPLGHAQETDDVYALPEITVTASGFEQTVDEAPASVTVISGAELQKRQATSLTDILSEVQGVAVTGVAGEQDISIRGLPGDYTMIMVDGVRQGTRESRTNGSAGYEQSFIPPVSAIDRIEVVRGPMSSLYGSDAMGGVVNIITKRQSPVWTGSVSVSGTVPEHGADGASQQTQFYLSGPLTERLGLSFWGRALNADESGKLDGAPERRDRDLTARLDWAMTETQDLQFEIGRSEVTHTATPGESLAFTNFRGRANALSEQKNTRDHVSLKHDARFDWGETQLIISRERGERESWADNVESARKPEITNTTVDGRATMPFEAWGSHRAIFGAQYVKNELNDQNPGIGSTRTFAFDMDQTALYAEDEWSITEDFALTFGGRVTDHSEYGTHVSPRVYGVYTMSPDWVIKGGVSTGYKTPGIRSIVPGYYYTTEGGAGVIVSDPDIDPEESTTAELGTTFYTHGWKLGATTYYTEFKNKVESYKTAEEITLGGTTYNRWDLRNVDAAKLYGVELTANGDLTDTLSLRGSYTYAKSEQTEGDFEGLPLSRTPRHRASLTLDWVTPVAGLDAWGTVTYNGKEVNAGARIGTNGTPYATNAAGTPIAYEYDAYTTLDLGLDYALNDRTTLSGAIYNVFDKETTSSEQNTVNEGRRLWMAVTTTF